MFFGTHISKIILLNILFKKKNRKIEKKGNVYGGRANKSPVNVCPHTLSHPPLETF